MLQDLGVTVEVVLLTDSSAAESIVNRRGLGKVRRIEVSMPWLQDQVARGKRAVHTVRGEDNFADRFSKHAGVKTFFQTMIQCNHTEIVGRHSIMPSVGRDSRSASRASLTQDDYLVLPR